MISFRCEVTSGAARAGVLSTPHGDVLTPAFMPVGTRAAVKAASPQQVEATGAAMIIMNTYHLLIRPGPEVVARHGGLHGFSRWPHAIATDSGGFQAYSLSPRTRLTPDGFQFSSHLDGSKIDLTPETSMRVQGALGSDIAMQLDVCPAAGAPARQLQRAVDLTTAWAHRCLKARRPGQALFGIVQGGTNLELRLEHARVMNDLPVDGIALGGLSVGEPRDDTLQTVALVAPALDAARPRYLMGVGTPWDLVAAIGHGVDLFDCVLPTRNARNGQAFVTGGRLAIRNSRYRTDLEPLEKGCTCPACSGGYSRSYLRHLYLAGEMLSVQLLTLHNLTYYQKLVRDARRAVLSGQYSAWAEAQRAALGPEARGRGPEVVAADPAGVLAGGPPTPNDG